MKRGCTQCGECLNVCPVYRCFGREEYSPKAKRLLMEPLDEGFADSRMGVEFEWEQVRELARLCAGCGRCRNACARKLSTADLLADVRAAHPHWTQQLWDVWIKRMGPAWLSLGYMSAAVPDWCAPQALKPMLATARGLVDKGDAAIWARLTKDPAVQVDTARPVAIFAGCTARNVRGKWAEKAGALLRAWGYTLLDDPDFGCCGGTMRHAGRLDTQKHMEEHNVAVWRKLGRPCVAVFCASCCHALAGYGDTALQGTEAEGWTKSLMPLSVLLQGAVPAPLAEQPADYGYHQPCHWDADKDIGWLKTLFPGLIQGLEPCCGMGGILQMSNAVLSRKMADACHGGFPPQAKHILTGCSGCVMQLNAAAPTGVKVSHWLDVVSV
ncbi:MAG: (Fe-S)-binding protein [Deltaproteobacteria bacterium]|nr:(Fe-S)-binding protein [Deltaproteobacteria bacterium]